jgi:hypothetical protein
MEVFQQPSRTADTPETKSQRQTNTHLHLKKALAPYSRELLISRLFRRSNLIYFYYLKIAR